MDIMDKNHVQLGERLTNLGLTVNVVKNKSTDESIFLTGTTKAEKRSASKMGLKEAEKC